MRPPHPEDSDTIGGSTPVPAADSAYWSFYDEVACRQVTDWAPQTRSRVLDLSGPLSPFAGRLAAAGHDVVHGDAQTLQWLRDGSVDAVLAESGCLSRCLATEVTISELARVLRGGGTLLLVVDALGLGLARLAEQGRWAELADVPHADVVLVPGAGDAITRCFWPEELVDLMAAAGLEVDWVRPRTVLGPAAVERALAPGGRAALGRLVETELALAVQREGEAPGLHLVVSARRPA